MEDDDRLERTRAIIEAKGRELRHSFRRERRRQGLRYLLLRPYFVLEMRSRKPTLVDLAGTRINPLWDTVTSGVADLDVVHPMNVKRRETLGLAWILGHSFYECQVTIVLVVDTSEQAWLVPYGEKPYSATPAGWQKMIDQIGPSFAQKGGGQWR